MRIKNAIYFFSGGTTKVPPELLSVCTIIMLSVSCRLYHKTSGELAAFTISVYAASCLLYHIILQAFCAIAAFSAGRYFS